MKVNNLVTLAVVLVVVTGVAWFRAARDAAGAADRQPTASAQEGELCPEPPPKPVAVETPTSAPTAPTTNAAGAKKLPRVVDLGADKCKACKDLAPILAALKKEYEGRVIVEFIDVWKDPKAGEPYKISVIPTQVFYDRDGNEVWRNVGFLPKEDFVKKFAELGVK